MIDFQKFTSLHDIQTEGDIVFLRELIDAYIGDLPGTIQQIAKSIEQDDCKKLKFLAHRLKGGSTTVGVDTISEISKSIEDSLTGNRITEETRILAVNLLEIYETVIDDLEDLKERYFHI